MRRRGVRPCRPLDLLRRRHGQQPDRDRPRRCDLRVQTEHFRLFGGHDAGLTRARARPIGSKREYPRILRELHLDALPVVTVRIWQDETTSTSTS